MVTVGTYTGLPFNRELLLIISVIGTVERKIKRRSGFVCRFQSIGIRLKSIEAFPGITISFSRISTAKTKII